MAIALARCAQDNIALSASGMLKPSGIWRTTSKTSTDDVIFKGLDEGFETKATTKVATAVKGTANPRVVCERESMKP